MNKKALLERNVSSGENIILASNVQSGLNISWSLDIREIFRVMMSHIRQREIYTSIYILRFRWSHLNAVYSDWQVHSENQPISDRPVTMRILWHGLIYKLFSWSI